MIIHFSQSSSFMKLSAKCEEDGFGLSNARSTKAVIILCTSLMYSFFRSRVMSHLSVKGRYFSKSASSIMLMLSMRSYCFTKVKHPTGFEPQNLFKNTVLDLVDYLTTNFRKFFTSKIKHLQMAHPSGETSNRLFQTLEDWNTQLKANSNVMAPRP